MSLIAFMFTTCSVQVQMRRTHDIVLYGASGFTGRLVARYLAKNGGSGLRIALAGRNTDRLRLVRDEAAAASGSGSWDPPLVACSSDDHEGLLALAASTSVVISTAGPFSLCGTPLVGACAASATDYVDINGETPWVRSLIDRFDGMAAENGARIVPNCGYTVPSDLAAHHAAQLLAERHGLPASRVRSLVQFNGRLSGGTLLTGILLDEASASVQAARRDPFLLGGSPVGGARPEDADPTAAEYDASLGVWTAPFWMADISSRIVRRSSALFQEAAASTGTGANSSTANGAAPRCYYADDFHFRERALAKDESVARNLAMPTPPPETRQRLIERGKLPTPGHGPSAEVRERSWFRNFVVCEAAYVGERSGGSGGGSGSGGGGGAPLVLTSVRGGDPGYEETSKMVAEAALLLTRWRDAPPDTPRQGLRMGGRVGGVLTPAFAFGEGLRTVLHERGVEFVEHVPPEGSTVGDELRRLAAERVKG